MDELAEKHGDDITFLLVNTRGIEDAKTYKANKQLVSEKLLHGGNRPPAEYGLKYIPHKTLIGRDGKVVKNFEDVKLSTDVPALLK
mmetsp:Transcript_75739/g.214078  ORF Transcript_75739/g.214078 Transcript_75739/m.214078 type:complete len:86 (-) Transcript_75739:93-350(-)